MAPFTYGLLLNGEKGQKKKKKACCTDSCLLAACCWMLWLLLWLLLWLREKDKPTSFLFPSFLLSFSFLSVSLFCFPFLVLFSCPKAEACIAATKSVGSWLAVADWKNYCCCLYRLMSNTHSPFSSSSTRLSEEETSRFVGRDESRVAEWGGGERGGRGGGSEKDDGGEKANKPTKANSRKG